MDSTTLPGVNPGMLRAADTWCPRRVACDLDDLGKTNDFFARGRLREALLASARDAHVTLRRPDRAMFRPTSDLVDDEQHAFGLAADGYIEIFGEAPAVVVVDHGADRPMPSKRNGVTIRGWVDLVVVDADAAVELRQLELWHRQLCADPSESWEMLCAAARLRPWLAGRPLRITHADLYSGLTETYVWDPADAAALGDLLATRVEEIRSIADVSDPRPGVGCAHCGHIASCPALRGG